MLRRIGLGRRSLTLALAALAALSAGLLTLALGAWPQVERSTLNDRFAVRGAIHTAPGVVVVGIDDKTFSELGLQWPFPRRLHAEVIDRLRQAGAKAIAYDVQFTEPSRSPRDDLALYAAVRRARDVVLATTEVDGRGHADVFGSEANVRAAHALVGMANLPADRGGVIRRYTRTMLGHESFAVAAARTAGHRVGADRFSGGQALIDYRGGPGTIPTVSFADVLRGDVSASVFRGRIVVVGATSATLQDQHATSTTSSAPMAGAEVQANAIWTAMHDNPLTPAPGWLAVVAVIACALVAPAVALRFRVLVSALAGIGAIGLYLVAAQLAFDAGIVFVVSDVVLAGAIGIAGMVVAGYVAAFAERNAFRRQLQASQLELLQRLAQAIDSRNAETGEHTQRIGMLCRRLALELGWSSHDAQRLMHAAIAHDVGKIGLSDSILLKPGPLDVHERDEMQSHTEIGARLLSGSENPLLQMAERIALSHHERWDGAGYPHGLVGPEIPVEGRICAVVDVYDALLSTRSYKQAWTVEQTLAELRRGRASQFDPDVLDAFMRLAPTLHAELTASLRRDSGPVALAPQPA